MEFILISKPDTTDHQTEIDCVMKGFAAGLQIFHLRKPDATEAEVELWLNNIATEYHPEIVLHQHFRLAHSYQVKGIHLPEKTREIASIQDYRKIFPGRTVSTSCHNVAELLHLTAYDYVFLSPVFDSISKQGYLANINFHAASSEIRKIKQQYGRCRIFALGGVSVERIATLKNHQFDGIAVLGAVWESSDPLLQIKQFIRAVNLSRD